MSTDAGDQIRRAAEPLLFNENWPLSCLELRLNQYQTKGVNRKARLTFNNPPARATAAFPKVRTLALFQLKIPEAPPALTWCSGENTRTELKASLPAGAAGTKDQGDTDLERRKRRAAGTDLDGVQVSGFSSFQQPVIHI